MKIGVVGLGSIGMRHYQNALKLGHEACAYDPQRFPNGGGNTFEFERDLYDWCDAAVIATPSNCHEAGLRACVERGKHVLVEKPISTSIGQLPELLARAKEKKLIVMMGNNLRFHPAIRGANVFHDANWANFICATKTDKPSYLSDGVVLNTGSHEVDLALYMFGPARLLTATGRRSEHSEEIADFVLLHDGGVRSSFHLDFVTEREVRQIWVSDGDSNWFCDLPHRFERMYGDMHEGGHTEYAFGGSYDDDYLTEMQRFVEAIEGKDIHIPTGDDGLATLRLLLDIRQRIALPHA